MTGIPVVIAENGLGAPVKPVDEGAPVMTIADNGLGAPIVISDNGAPFIVEGYSPDGWRSFVLDAGELEYQGEPTGGVGFGNGENDFTGGQIDREPIPNHYIIYIDEYDGVLYFSVSGDVADEMNSRTLYIDGTPVDIADPAYYHEGDDYTTAQYEPYGFVAGNSYVIEWK